MHPTTLAAVDLNDDVPELLVSASLAGGVGGEAVEVQSCFPSNRTGSIRGPRPPPNPCAILHKRPST